MANLSSIERDKKNIIKDLKPSEMEAYLKTLIANLYDSFIDGNEKKALASKKLIEEATKIYEAEGYTDCLAVEYRLRLEKANELLANTLVDKQKTEVEHNKLLVEAILESLILRVITANNILGKLIATYEKEPSEELASTIKDIVEDYETGFSKYESTLEHENMIVFSEEIEIFKDYYSTFQDLLRKINRF